ncbi:DNA ligase 1-like [Senna tora]|uniref:DNA ligase 1-like n=1 Tax=Senna tora TaxID=362788 RepID=A0A834SQR7_9FABA|nr:DNA ligase 1-like [Senna tora]
MTMARTPCRHFVSCRSLLNRHTSWNALSSPSIPGSPDIRVHAKDSPMAVDRDPFSEESFRASVESRPPLHASQAFLENAIKFHFCVANHPFLIPLLGHDGIGFLFFVFVAEVIGVVPPFSDFVVSFLNCINVCPAQLAPNAWVFLWSFEEICESVRVEPSLRFFFYLFQVQLRSAQDIVFIRHATQFPVLFHISRNVHGWGGRFVRISTVADLCPFWFCADLQPLFPLHWSAFHSPPPVPLSSLSETERAAIAVLTTRCPCNMGDFFGKAQYNLFFFPMVRMLTYVFFQQLVLMHSLGSRGRTPSATLVIRSSPPAEGSIFERLCSRCTKEEANEEVPRHSKKEPAVESSRRQGKSLWKRRRRRGPMFIRGLDLLRMDSEQEGLTRTIRFCASLLYKALSGLRGVGALVGSAESKIATYNSLHARDMLRQASTLGDFSGVRQELAGARQTIRELEEALGAKNSVSPRCFAQVLVILARPEPVLHRPSPPPGFDPLVKKSKEQEDSEDDHF